MSKPNPRFQFREQVKRSDLKPTTKLVGLVLSDYMNADGECWPSQERLASDCSLKPRAVRIHIDALKDKDLLVIIHRSRGLDFKTNKYVAASSPAALRAARAKRRSERIPKQLQAVAAGGASVISFRPAAEADIEAERARQLNALAESSKQIPGDRKPGGAA